MAFIVRYDIITRWSITPVVHAFATEAAAVRFMQDKLPAGAHNVSKYAVSDDEPRQQPTWYHAPRAKTPWWDANKRPFTDKYELNNEV